MKWHKKMYIGESVKDSVKAIRFEMAVKKVVLGYYMILLPEDGSTNLLDIVPSSQFALPCYKKRRNVVIGVAGDKMEAMELSGLIVGDVYTATHGFEIGSYFEHTL